MSMVLSKDENDTRRGRMLFVTCIVEGETSSKSNLKLDPTTDWETRLAADDDACALPRLREKFPVVHEIHNMPFQRNISCPSDEKKTFDAEKGFPGTSSLMRCGHLAAGRDSRPANSSDWLVIEVRARRSKLPQTRLVLTILTLYDSLQYINLFLTSHARSCLPTNCIPQRVRNQKRVALFHIRSVFWSFKRQSAETVSNLM